jgi:leucyl-tRNA synthetase
MTYVCVMFPYPSGAGLHLGHYYNYAVMDSYCRWQRRSGEVFQPFGYDAFGLPAENYARAIGGDPREVTEANIDNFRRQIANMRTEYRECLVTSHPSYVEQTQWLFTRLLENDLAYKAEAEVNWCEACGTVLANEQAQEGICERHGTPVERRRMEQWFFRITAYRDRLIAGLDNLDYPAGTIKQQRDWLANLHDWCVSRQRAWGCPIPIEGETDTLDTFVDSSFYYLAYQHPVNGETMANDYRPVDLYVGGPEHACLHLIYARFINMFLFDIGIAPEEEPFRRVIHQGMITANGAKISKRNNNGVAIENYDPAELRFYLMFLGHYFDGGDWSDQHIVGVTKFFRRMRLWLSQTGNDAIDIEALVEAVDRNVAAFKFNKVVSSFMEFYNRNKAKRIAAKDASEIAGLLDVFAPGWRAESDREE